MQIRNTCKIDYIFTNKIFLEQGALRRSLDLVKKKNKINCNEHWSRSQWKTYVYSHASKTFYTCSHILSFFVNCGIYRQTNENKLLYVIYHVLYHKTLFTPPSTMGVDGRLSIGVLSRSKRKYDCERYIFTSFKCFQDVPGRTSTVWHVIWKLLIEIFK